MAHMHSFNYIESESETTASFEFCSSCDLLLPCCSQGKNSVPGRYQKKGEMIVDVVKLFKWCDDILRW